VRTGWGVRDLTGVWSEVPERAHAWLSVNAGYFNTGRLLPEYRQRTTRERNLLVGPEDFDQFCRHLARDRALLAACYQICGLSNVKPRKVRTEPDIFGFRSPGLGKTFGAITSSDSCDSRMPGGVRVGGGFDAGHMSKDQCSSSTRLD